MKLNFIEGFIHAKPTLKRVKPAPAEIKVRGFYTNFLLGKSVILPVLAQLHDYAQFLLSYQALKLQNNTIQQIIVPLLQGAFQRHYHR